MKITSSMTVLLISGGAAAAAAGYAWAQGFPGISITSPSGAELIEVQGVQPNGQPSPIKNVVNINQIRNATGYLLVISSATASGTVTVSSATNELLVNVQPNTSTWVLPSTSSVFDAEQFQFCNVSGAAFATNTINLVAGAGTNINTGSTSATSVSATSLTSQTCIELAFANSTKQWYRIR